MQAIKTRYYGPTGSKGPRIRCVCDAGSLTVPYPHEFNEETAHAFAASRLMVRLGWTRANGYAGLWTTGALPNQSGYVHVYRDGGFTPDDFTGDAQ